MLHVKRNSVDMPKLKILSGDIILHCLDGSNLIKGVLIRLKVSLQSQREVGDVTLLPLKVEAGDISQEMQMALRFWKRQGNGFFPRESRKKMQPC